MGIDGDEADSTLQNEENMVIEEKHIKLLRRLRKGECPRCSKADFQILYAALGGHIQLEGARGARGAMLLNVLRDEKETIAAIDRVLSGGRRDVVQVAHEVMRQATGEEPKKNPYDKTSSKRQEAYLERLEEVQGKRLLVDLDGERLAKLEALVKAGYGESKVGVIRRAIDDVHRKNIKIG